MFTGQFQSLAMMLRGILGLPPGVTRLWSSNRGGQQSGLFYDVMTDGMVQTVVEITADDVCIGHSPFYLSGLDTLRSPDLRSRFESLLGCVQGISRWAAIDLLKRGVSAYSFHLGDGSAPRLVPFNEDFRIFMRRDGGLVVYGSGGELLENLLLFLNYDKESLVSLSKESDDFFGGSVPEEAQLLYEIHPVAFQLRDMESTARDLWMQERAMYRYRQKLSRVVRLVTVDVGMSSGDGTQEVIDDLSQVINADSMSLGGSVVGMEGQMFDDEIPVLPTRKGVGRPEIMTDIPNFDIDKLRDFDYTLSKFFMMARFPRSYADFSQQMDSNTVSLLRGDIRYARLVGRVRSCMEDTLNSWYRSSLEDLRDCEVAFRLVKLPTSEDSDVSEVVDSFMSMNNQWLEMVDSCDSRARAELLLDSLESLLSDTSNLHSVQRWLEVTRSYVKSRFDELDRAESRVDSVGDAVQDFESSVSMGSDSGSPVGVEVDVSESSLREAQERFGAPSSVPEGGA